MNIRYRDEIISNIEQAIKSADKVIAHLESLCRNISNDLSIQEKRNYTNKLYDDMDAFDRFKQNASITLNEAKILPQTEVVLQIRPVEVFTLKKTKNVSNTYNNDFVYTTVDKIVFCDKKCSVRSWAEALITIAEIVIKEKNVTPSMLLNSDNLKGKRREYFSRNATSLRKSYQLSNGCFMELNFSAKEIYKISHLIVSEFGYSEGDLEINFSKKAGYIDAILSDEKDDLLYTSEISEEAYEDPVKMLKELEKSL